jgi:hypothetical protein
VALRARAMRDYGGCADMAGDFETDDALERVEGCFGEIPRGADVPPLPGRTELEPVIGETVRETVEAIRAAQPAVKPRAVERSSLRAAKTTRTARSRKSTERPSQPPPVVSVRFSNMLTTARPEEVWAAIRERQGEPFTVDELQATLGASVGPYVMIWARDGFLIKADRDASPGASWRYRLLRDDPEHPPVG